MIRTRFSGKLFLMGEYAVMHRGQPALVAAVDRYLSVFLQESDSYRVDSRYGTLLGTDVFVMDGKQKHVKAALITAQKYLAYHNCEFKVFSLIIESELDSLDDRKYGLGSSGVVMVAILDAVLKLHQCPADQLLLFKLAVWAQLEINELSSGGDLAAAIYGGVIVYRRYDVSWLMAAADIGVVLAQWPDLSIEPVAFHRYRLLVGWSGQPHNSRHYLAQVESQAQREPKQYERFLHQASTTVMTMVQALRAADDALIEKCIVQYRESLQWLADFADIVIETPKLQRCIDIAAHKGIAMKVSGAGGGDCAIGVVLEDNHEILMQIKTNWAKNDILYLDIEVSESHEI